MYLIEKLKMSIMEILMKKNEYAQQVRQINCTSGYFHRFYELVGDCPRHEDAWRKLEDERDRYRKKHGIVGKTVVPDFWV